MAMDINHVQMIFPWKPPFRDFQTSHVWLRVLEVSGSPEEMFSPFIEAAVDSMKRFVVDPTALQAFSTFVEGMVLASHRLGQNTSKIHRNKKANVRSA